MMNVANLIVKRMQEARAQGRLINQEPLLAEIRKNRKRILPQNSLFAILVNRAGDFVIDVSTQLRSMDLWSSLVASEIASNILSKVKL